MEFVTKLNIYPEQHCELCGEIVHNHIDCLYCKTQNVSTDAFCDLRDVSDGFTMKCRCGAQYKLISKNDTYYINQWDWEVV